MTTQEGAIEKVHEAKDLLKEAQCRLDEAEKELKECDTSMGRLCNKINETASMYSSFKVEPYDSPYNDAIVVTYKNNSFGAYDTICPADSIFEPIHRAGYRINHIGTGSTTEKLILFLKEF